MDELIFHYCSTQTFFEIIKGGTLWLSSMKLSNDTMEGKWILSRIESVTHKIKGREEEIDCLLHYLRGSYKDFTTFACCFSKKPDLLSQWRGYADDGCGFSLGFSKKALRGLLDDEEDIYLDEINYVDSLDINLIVSEINDTIEAIRKTNLLKSFTPIDAIEFIISDENPDHDLFHGLRHAFSALQELERRLFLFKNPAFKEEMEWRIYRPTFYVSDKIKYFPKKNTINPYYPMIFSHYTDILKQIWIGPKNNTPKDVIYDFVKHSGFRNFDVQISTASYR